MSTVTFIHAADLHLGAPFKGLRSLAPAWNDALLHAIPKSFKKVIDLAISEEVDFVVLSGDIFDNSHPSYADFSLFVSELTRLQQLGIPVYFVTGNHDPYISWDSSFSALPENAHLLGVSKAEFACYERDGQPIALIGGRSYYTQSWPSDEDISEGISRETAMSELGISAPFMIGVIHTGLDIDPTRSPVKPRTLLMRNVDYWACGHIHQPKIFPSSDDPRIVFSGCPQGRDMKEEGEHGAFKVTLETGKPNKTEFFPAASIAWKRLELDISECDTISEVQERIIDAEFSCNAQTRCQRMMFRLSLTGRSSLHADLTEAVLEDVRNALNDGYPFFFVDAIANRTKPPLNYKALRKEGLFPSVYFEAMDDCRHHEQEVLLDLEKQFYQRDLTLPSAVEQQFSSLCDEAETLVLDLLGRDDER
ncbi:MAG: DNA repair exonuclease [Eggerthellaceae bacterium]